MPGKNLEFTDLLKQWLKTGVPDKTFDEIGDVLTDLIEAPQLRTNLPRITDTLTATVKILNAVPYAQPEIEGDPHDGMSTKGKPK